MSAPERPPIFNDAIAGREIPPSEAADWFIGNFVSLAGTFPDWLVEDTEIAVTVSPQGQAEIGFSARGVTGTIAFSQEPGGWIEAVASAGGREVFRGYIERAYEQYEVWPANAGAASGEAPGRIGKHGTWVSLAAAAWPALAPLAPGGWLNAAADEDALRGRKSA